jgi:hypothetical protein
MPNNFRITGNVYVSKEGSDSNDGLTPETPKLTVQAALDLATSGNRTVVIGAGVYTEPINKTWSVGSQLSIIADGEVVMQGQNNEQQFVITLVSFGATLTITGITFKGYKNLLFIPPGNMQQQNIFTFFDCNILCNIFLSPSANNGAIQVLTIRNCVLQNCYLITFTGGSLNGQFCIYNSILINCIVSGAVFSASTNCCTVFVNSYADSSSIIGFNVVANVFFRDMNFNNIQGKIIMNSNGAVSGANSNGVALSFAQHRIDYPTFNVNSISADPKFNDVRNLNFTLQSDSPHIKAANDFISNIGGTEYAVYKSAASTEFTTGATISGLTLQANNSYIITSSPTPGTIETAPIQVQSFPGTRPLTKLEWVGSLEFDKSITAGTAGNNNVPDWDTYTSGAGASPDRLTVKMRYSTQSAQPTTNSEWDNGGYWTAGNYELFEINAKPKVDVNGKGNGNPDYVETGSLGDLVPTWIQLNIKLIDTYNP